MTTTDNVPVDDLPSREALEAALVRVQLAIDIKREAMAFRFALLGVDVAAVVEREQRSLDEVLRLTEVARALTVAMERHADLLQTITTRLPQLRLVGPATD